MAKKSAIFTSTSQIRSENFDFIGIADNTIGSDVPGNIPTYRNAYDNINQYITDNPIRGVPRPHNLDVFIVGNNNKKFAKSCDRTWRTINYVGTLGPSVHPIIWKNRLFYKNLLTVDDIDALFCLLYATALEVIDFNFFTVDGY